jgi:CHAT domain-containing protein
LNRWTSLPETAEESRAIAEIHEECFAAGQRTTLADREATEVRVKEELARHDVVHLATHGFFQPEGLPSMWRQVKSPSGERRMEMFEEERRLVGLMPGLLSGLVFAGANRIPESGREDGLLTAEEISLLDLSKVDLVVLSACETALGKAEAGEGVLGLRRTFRQSGARCVISSLWSVKDRTTNLLMQRFYERLWLRGQGTQKALRGAQLDMLKQNRIENDGDGLPSTWGAFVLDGDWQ